MHHFKSLPDKIWILIDISNGGNYSKGYCWIFPTRDLARKHKKWQKSNSKNAKLSVPIQYIKTKSFQSSSVVKWSFGLPVKFLYILFDVINKRNYCHHFYSYDSAMKHKQHSKLLYNDNFKLLKYKKVL